MVSESELVEQFRKTKGLEKPNFPSESLPKMSKAAEEEEKKR